MVLRVKLEIYHFPTIPAERLYDFKDSKIVDYSKLAIVNDSHNNYGKKRAIYPVRKHRCKQRE
jgi:hypothetical protein